MNIPQGPWYIDDLLTFTVTTHRFDTGALTDADAVPAYRVYEDETGAAILTGNMAKLDDANTTGFYSEQLTLSAANGFEAGKSYAVYVTAAVNSVTGGQSGGFKMSGVHPANLTQIGGVAQSATDLKDFADDGYDPATNKVQGLVLADAVTTVNGLAANVITAAATASDFGTEMAAAVWDRLTSALTTVSSIGKLLVDNIDATISSRSSHAAADIWAVATRLLTAGTNIVLAKGVGVTGFNDLSAAQVNAEADTALADVGVTTTVTGRIDVAVSTRLASAGYTAPPSAATIAATVWAEVLDGTRTAIQLARGWTAALLGKANGLATTNAKYRDIDDTKDVIDAVVDADGNRSTVNLDLT